MAKPFAPGGSVDGGGSSVDISWQIGRAARVCSVDRSMAKGCRLSEGCRSERRKKRDVHVDFMLL